MSADEMFEVLDKVGNKTGEVLSRKQVHAEELWHALSFVWVYNDKGEVILQLRSSDRQSYPDLWDVSAGGHPSAGETYEEGAVKETEEELSLSIDQSELEFIAEGQDVHELVRGVTHNAYYKLYLVQYAGDDSVFHAQASEVSDIKWMPAAQVLMDRKDPEKTKQYTGRDVQIYEMALNKIIEKTR